MRKLIISTLILLNFFAVETMAQQRRPLTPAQQRQLQQRRLQQQRAQQQRQMQQRQMQQRQQRSQQQPQMAAPTSTISRRNPRRLPVQPPRVIEKYLLSADYNSWFEKLTITSNVGNVQESQALYYGFGFGVEKNWYHPTWGWGLGGSLLTGSSVGGDRDGTLTYFQARVPWYAARISPRIFYRWTARTDFGLDLAMFYKQSSWPQGTNADVTVKSGSDLVTGAFLDLRVRINPKLEMIQAFGMVYKDQSIFWRLGLAYRL